MAAGRATPPLLKDLNERTVLEAIRAAAPISRAEISRRVGISKPTVSQALQSLLAAGLVREAGQRGDGPSYGATFFEPVPEAAFVLGLDLGARFVRGAVCDVRGEIRTRQDVELAERTAAASLDAIESLSRSLLDAAGATPSLVDSVVLEHIDHDAAVVDDEHSIKRHVRVCASTRALHPAVSGTTP